MRQLLWETLRPQLLAEQRQLMMEALQPVAEAMKRLDQRLVQQAESQQELRELLLEVLNSLQPTASQQLLPRLESTRPPSSLSSAS